MTGQRAEILIIEDIVGQSMSLQRLLDFEGFDSTIVNSVKEWRSGRETFDPSGIILDVMMSPSSDAEAQETFGGFLMGTLIHQELLAEYQRRMQEVPPIAIVTALAGAAAPIQEAAREYFVSFLNSGSIAWFDKPPDTSELITFLRSAIGPDKTASRSQDE